MAITYPLPLANFAQLLPQQTSRLTLLRFDEISGSADGRFWGASMAKPLWQAEVSLAARPVAEAERYAAMIDALDGMRGSFLWFDPAYYGPSGGDAGAAVVIAAIASDRTGLSLGGLPEAFPIRVGDRISVALGSSRYYYGRFTESGTADTNGETGSLSVHPYLPLSAAVTDAVEMNRPVMRMMIPPGGYTPFTVSRGNRAEGASIRMLQRP